MSVRHRRGFSRARRSTRSTVSSGRQRRSPPVGGYVQRRSTSWRCQRSNVPGVTGAPASAPSAGVGPATPAASDPTAYIGAERPAGAAPRADGAGRRSPRPETGTSAQVGGLREAPHAIGVCWMALVLAAGALLTGPSRRPGPGGRRQNRVPAPRCQSDAIARILAADGISVSIARITVCAESSCRSPAAASPVSPATATLKSSRLTLPRWDNHTAASSSPAKPRVPTTPWSTAPGSAESGRPNDCCRNPAWPSTYRDSLRPATRSTCCLPIAACHVRNRPQYGPLVVALNAKAAR
jgi:hypothetical protein